MPDKLKSFNLYLIDLSQDGNYSMKSLTLITLLACLSLTACKENSETPKLVAQKYWQSLKNGDIATAKSLVSINTQAELQTYLALPDEEKIPLSNIDLGAEQATVNTLITVKSAVIDTNQIHDPAADHAINFETVLVLENGQWKIDALRTQVPAPKKPTTSSNDKQLPDALQENLDSMDNALEQGTDILNEFMREGSKEMSESLLKGMNKMNDALRDAVDKMKKRRELREDPEPSTNNKNGGGLI